MCVQGVEIFGCRMGYVLGYAGKHRTDHLFAQDEEAGQGANAHGENPIIAGFADSLDELFASKLAKVISGLPAGIRCQIGNAQ